MTLLVQVLAATAVLIVLLLLYLFFFERGAFYRTDAPVHDLDDAERLRILSAVLTTPVQAIETLQTLSEGPDLYRALIAAIRRARHSIHLEAYIFYPGDSARSVVEALRERARAGVQVRVIVDAVGSWRTSQDCFRELLAAGGRVYRYHPLHWHMLLRWNSRTHRNLLLIDGEVAFIGGAGIADHWSRTHPAPWRDSVFRATGPIVAGLQGVFAENWLECAGELLVGPDSLPRTAPGPGGIPALAVGSTPTAGRSTKARMLVQFLLATARENIDLCSPYFLPDFGIRRELIAARKRGVAIRVLTGGPYGDHGVVRRAGRRRYGKLLEEGVEISEFASHMMHSKLLIVDGRWVLVGTTNIDPRSFGLNDEVNLLLLDAQTGSRLREVFERDLTQSDRLDLATWHRRSLGERFLATLGRVFERHQ
jgi:cardiolipin synthase